MILLRLIELLFQIDIRNRFAGKFSFLFDSLLSVFSLTIYWYTSKIFSVSIDSPLNLYKQDYFSYIVWGEIILALPFFFVDSFVIGMKSSFVEGVFETLHTLPVKYKAQYWMPGMLKFPRELLRVFIQLILAIIIFDLVFSIKFVLVVVPIILFAIPAFAGLGYLFLSIFIITGRGNAISSLVNSFFAFAAGAYFPLSLLPNWVEVIGKKISPFTSLLEYARLILSESYSGGNLEVILSLLILNFVYGAIGFFMFKHALIKFKQNGNTWTAVG